MKRIALTEPVTTEDMRKALEQLNGDSGLLVLVDQNGLVLNEMYVGRGLVPEPARA